MTAYYTLGKHYFVVMLLVLLVGCQPSENNSKAEATSPAIVQDSLLTFQDPNSGISFRYPASYTLNPNVGIPDQPSINIAIERLGDLNGTLGYDSTTAYQERASLARGMFGPKVDFPVEPSMQVEQLPDGQYAKTFAVMRRHEICDVTFNYIFITYLNGFQVRINMTTPAKQVIQQNPHYFTKDPNNCSDLLIWKEDGPKDFYHDLTERKIDGAAASWHDAFRAFVSSVQIN